MMLIKNFISYMRASGMDKWSWFKNADLILVCSSYLASISAAVKTTNSYIIVYCSRNNLYPFKVAGKDYYVTASCIGLERKKF